MTNSTPAFISFECEDKSLQLVRVDSITGLRQPSGSSGCVLACTCGAGVYRIVEDFRIIEKRIKEATT